MSYDKRTDNYSLCIYFSNPKEFKKETSVEEQFFEIQDLKVLINFKRSDDDTVVFGNCSGSFLLDKALFNTQFLNSDNLPLVNIIETFHNDNDVAKRVSYKNCVITSTGDISNYKGDKTILLNFHTNHMPILN